MRISRINSRKSQSIPIEKIKEKEEKKEKKPLNIYKKINESCSILKYDFNTRNQKEFKKRISDYEKRHS
jgi:hypothetical protein